MTAKVPKRSVLKGTSTNGSFIFYLIKTMNLKSNCLQAGYTAFVGTEIHVHSGLVVEEDLVHENKENSQQYISAP